MIYPQFPLYPPVTLELDEVDNVGRTSLVFGGLHHFIHITHIFVLSYGVIYGFGFSLKLPFPFLKAYVTIAFALRTL
jgi:hypothetical protein